MLITNQAKDPPQSGFFAYGLTVVSILIAVIVVINYSKCSIDLDLLHRGVASVVLVCCQYVA